MRAPAHTPYDGSSKPFAIGLKPLEADDWIVVDDTYDAQMREKRRLYATVHDKVFVAEDGTQAAQGEVFDLLLHHLPRRFPERFRAGCKGVLVSGHPALTTTDRMAMPPLKAASLLVQEDLILMRRGEDGWRLAAGSLCFPSSWTLTEKFGRPLQEIHAPVPAFGPGTRNAELIHRMFDNLSRLVIRWNWTIQADDTLYHPFSNDQRHERAVTRPSKFHGVDMKASAFIRVERQTLRKLPVSGDILFTIRIGLDPIAALQAHQDRASLARSFATQLAELDQAQLDYKGLTADRDRLAAWLAEMAEG